MRVTACSLVERNCVFSTQHREQRDGLPNNTAVFVSGCF